jgi:hypothetical protein
VDDRSRVLIASVVGAAVGGVLGYLYMTESGAQVRAQLEPRIDDFVAEVRRLRGTVEKARLAADESWRSLSELVGDAPNDPGWPGGARQTSH